MRRQPNAAAAGGTFRRRVAGLAALIALPLIAGGALSRARLAASCPASRSPAAIPTPLQDRSLDRLVAQVEAHLEKNPEDGRGWEVVGAGLYAASVVSRMP